MSEQPPQTPEASHPTPMRLESDIAERLLSFAIEVMRVATRSTSPPFFHWPVAGCRLPVAGC